MRESLRKCSRFEWIIKLANTKGAYCLDTRWLNERTLEKKDECHVVPGMLLFLQNWKGLIYFMGDVTSSLIYENVYLLLSTDDLLVFSWVWFLLGRPIFCSLGVKSMLQDPETLSLSHITICHLILSSSKRFSCKKKRLILDFVLPTMFFFSFLLKCLTLSAPPFMVSFVPLCRAHKEQVLSCTFFSCHV